MARLRDEISIPTAVLGGVVAVTLAVLGVGAARESRALAREVNEVREANGLALAVTHAAEAEQRAILSYRFRPDASVGQRIAEEEARTARLLHQATAIELSPRAASMWSQFQQAHALLGALREELLDASRQGDPAALSLAFERWSLVSERATALLASFQVHQARRLERTIVELQRRRKRALEIAAASALVGTLVAGAFSLVLARRVTRPIVMMASAAERIAAEGLAIPVHGAERKDEVGVLARAFNGMTARLTAANARLSEAVRVREEFISIASHELKTPLTALKLQLQNALRAAARDRPPGGGPTPFEVSAGRLERLVTRVGTLVENMLDVSRLTSGRLALRREAVDVGEVVRETADRMREELARVGCDVRVESACDLTVHVDRSRLDQVLVNLISNAGRYAPGSPVLVRCARVRDDVEIEVEDRGPGIAPHDRERIFERFERAVDDRDAQPGLGLGLYISREIARAHGGDLSVRSEPGQGATFVLRLPATRADDGARGGDAAPPGGA